MSDKVQLCPECNTMKREDGFKSGVVNGQFVSERCGNCWTSFAQPRHSDAGAFNREKDREDHLRDIEQPFEADGVTPSRDFAHAWPKIAKELYFTPEQLEDL